MRLMPPGSACSVALMRNVAASGSVRGLHPVVSDVEAARAELIERGVAVSEPFHFTESALIVVPGAPPSPHGDLAVDADAA